MSANDPKRTLRRARYRPFGEEAIALLTGEHAPWITILFTDIQLSGKLSGWDVAEAFREVNPKIQVIYASGQYQDDERRVSGSTFFTTALYAPRHFRHKMGGKGDCRGFAINRYSSG